MLRRLTKSGVFWMIVSVVGGSLMQLFIKLSSENVSVFLQIFTRNLLGIATAGVFLAREGVKPVLGPRRYQPFLFARSVTGFLGLVTFFLSTRLGNLADVTIVNRTGPFFTTLFSVLFLRERARLPQWAALAVVFIGGIIAANPTFTSDALPMLLAFTCAVLNGVAYTLLAWFKDKVHAMTVVLHFSLVSAALCLPFVIRSFRPLSGRDVLILLMIAALGNLCVVSITLAYRLTPASEVSIYDQLSIVTAVIVGWLFLGERPGINTLAGGAIVITASALIYFYNRRRHRQEAAAAPASAGEKDGR